MRIQKNKMLGGGGGNSYDYLPPKDNTRTKYNRYKTIILILSWLIAVALGFFVFSMSSPKQAQNLPIDVQAVGIGNASSLQGMSTSGSYELNGNITVTASNWTPIGTSSSPFAGTFNGNGYTITFSGNVTKNYSTSYNYGFFGTTKGATIQNVKVVWNTVDVTGSTSTYVGGIVGAATDTTISNCYVQGTFTSTSTDADASCGGIVGEIYGTSKVSNCVNLGGTITTNTFLNASAAGGIAGFSEVTIENCHSSANVNAYSITSNAYAGGIVGSLKAPITNCHNTGTITASNQSSQYCVAVGGVVGMAATANASIANCYNEGDVTGKSTDSNAYVGGVVGCLEATITNCYNTGTIKGSNQSSQYYVAVGGVVGRAITNASIANCYNEGDVTGESTGLSADVGGIVGYSQATITNCYNEGNVTGESTDNNAFVGGIVGNLTATITNCYNTGTIKGSNQSSQYFLAVGGVVGYATTDASIANCYNEGDVTGESTDINAYVGGVVGYLETTITNCYNTGTIKGSNQSSQDIVAVGGVVGRATTANASIVNCFSLVGSSTNAPSASGSNRKLGGIVGSSEVNIDNCYFDYGTNNGYGAQRSDLSTIVKTKSYYSSSTYWNTSTAYKWDFTNVWELNSSRNESLPYIKDSYVTLTYSSGTGSTSSGGTHKVGTSVEPESTLFSRTGYTLSGWVDNNTGMTYKVGDRVILMQNTTLTAQWEIETYTISFNQNGGTGGQSNLNIEYNSALPNSVSVPIKANNNFDGYYSGGTQFYNGQGTLVNTSYRVKGELTLTAQWIPTLLNITYMNGNTVLKTAQVNYNVAFNLPLATEISATNTGHLMAGWRLGSTTGTLYGMGASVALQENTTFYLEWEPIPYTITFIDRTTTLTTKTVNYGTSYSLPTENEITATNKGYHITGWHLGGVDGQFYALGASITAEASLIYYLGWEANSYTVVFNANAPSGAISTGASGMNNQTFTYGASQNLTANAFAYKFYQFQGWATSSSGGVTYSNGQSVQNLTDENNGVVNLYAIWLKTSCTTTITITLNVPANSNTEIIFNILDGTKQDFTTATQIAVSSSKTITLELEKDKTYTIAITKPFSWQIKYNNGESTTVNFYEFTTSGSTQSHEIEISGSTVPNIWVVV